VCSCVIGNGKTVLVWKDDWHSNGLFCDHFPRLFSFALNEDVSATDMVNTPDIITMFTLPLSAQAFQELQHLRYYLVGLISDPDSDDSRIFPWVALPTHRPNSIISSLSKNLRTLCCNQYGNRKAFQSLVFSWLLIKDRLNTKDPMLRKHWNI
jgi:hypothetical protein